MGRGASAPFFFSMILSAQTIRRLKPVTPFCERATIGTMSYGLSAAGYDIRVAESFWLTNKVFRLASSLEQFNMPNDVLGIVHDKSSWARRGVAVQNTVIEPGWRGYLTLELTNHGEQMIWIEQGQPIAQIVFHRLDEPTEIPYSGKYQDQEAGPQSAR